VYPTVQDSYLDIPYGNNITSSRFKEEHSASVPSKWNCSKPANIFPAEGKGKCSESGSKRTIFSGMRSILGQDRFLGQQALHGNQITKLIMNQ
jgi:hypothetical protein